MERCLASAFAKPTARQVRGRGEQGDIVAYHRFTSALYVLAKRVFIDAMQSVDTRNGGFARVSLLTTASHLSRRRLGEGGSEAALQGSDRLAIGFSRSTVPNPK